MASGFGINGGNYQHDSNLFWLKHFLRVYLGRGRCFHFWQEFSKCYASADFPTQCNAERDDYLECLHHTKEVQSSLLNAWQYQKWTEELTSIAHGNSLLVSPVSRPKNWSKLKRENSWRRKLTLLPTLICPSSTLLTANRHWKAKHEIKWSPA